MKVISSTEAEAKLDALLAEIGETGEPMTITRHGKPVALLKPLSPPPRKLGEFAGLGTIPDDFDAPLGPAELALWEGSG